MRAASGWRRIDARLCSAFVAPSAAAMMAAFPSGNRITRFTADVFVTDPVLVSRALEARHKAMFGRDVARANPMSVRNASAFSTAPVFGGLSCRSSLSTPLGITTVSAVRCPSRMTPVARIAAAV